MNQNINLNIVPLAYASRFFIAYVVSTHFLFNHLGLIKYFKSGIIYIAVISKVLCNL